MFEKTTSGAAVLTGPEEITGSGADQDLVVVDMVDAPGSIRAELRREQKVDDIISELAEKIVEARTAGDESLKLLKLEPVAYKPGVLNWAVSIITKGADFNPPRKYDHLHSAAYEKLWNHLEGEGLKPFIKIEFFEDGGLVLKERTEAYLCTKLS